MDPRTSLAYQFSRTMLLRAFGGPKKTPQGEGKEPRGGKEQDTENGDNGGENKNDKKPTMWDFLFPVIAILTAHLLMSDAERSTALEISWQEFEQKFLRTGEVAQLTVDTGNERVYVRVHEGAEIDGVVQPTGRQIYMNVPSVAHFEKQLDRALVELGIHDPDAVPVHYTQMLPLIDAMLAMLPVVLTVGTWVLLFRSMRPPTGPGGGPGRGGGGRGFMDSIMGGKKVSVPVVVPKTRFADVAGMGEAKVEIAEFVQYLKDPKKLERLGGHLPKGALLVGPPGTGKTLLARALAGEAKVPFFSVSGADFVEMYVGVGPARVRSLFAEARKAAPSIVFIDEIDAVGRARAKGPRAGGGGSERENTLNQLLVEMDGFDATTGVVVLASTNRADILDNALLRPGRFDRQINCDLPTYDERKAIAVLYLKKLTMRDPTETHVERLAAMSAGMSGAQISAICNEAALKAARDGRDAVGGEDLDFAVARVYGGIERPTQTIQPVEREVLAVHEAGHAVVSWFLKGAERVLQVSILPRANSDTGYTQRMPSDRNLHSTSDILDRLCMLLAGRAAEQVLLSHTTTSGHDDLTKVTELAYKYVCQFGMDPLLGPMLYPYPAPPRAGRKKIADETARVIDSEVDRIVRTAFERAKQLVESHKDHIRVVATRLVAVGTLSEADLKLLLGPRPDAKLTTESPASEPVPTTP